MLLLGLASYYRRFIPNFARVAGTLYALTKTDTSFVWTVDCKCAFSKFKKSIMSSPLLFLTPIPVVGPFDRVGLDVIQIPRGRSK